MRATFLRITILFAAYILLTGCTRAPSWTLFQSTYPVGLTNKHVDIKLDTYSSKEACLEDRFIANALYEGDGTYDPFFCGKDCTMSPENMFICDQLCGLTGCM